MLGNVEERVKIMAEMGQVPLATMTAKTHNLTEFIERLEDQTQGIDVSSQIPAKAQLLLPPVALFRAEQGDLNWPLLKSTQQIFKEKAFEEQQASQLPEERAIQDFDDAPETTHADWEEAGDVNLTGGGAWGDDGLDGLEGMEGFDDLPDEPAAVETNSSSVTVGDSAQEKWLKK